MCCAMRAENSETDSAHSGEMNAPAATSQPPARSPLRRIAARRGRVNRLKISRHPDQDRVEVEAAENLARQRRRTAIWEQRMQIILP